MASVVNKLDAQVYWAQVPEWVLAAPISDRAVRLYGLLARRANSDSQCFPSRRLLADQMRCSVSSVDRALEELVDAGAISRKAQFVDNRQTVNLYTLLAMSSPVTAPLVTAEEGGVVTGDAQNESHRNESHTLAATPRERKPDLLFEAVAKAAGRDIRRLTKTERGKLNRATADIRAAGGTPDDVRVAANAWPRRFPQAQLTEMALAAHWSSLLPERKASSGWGEEIRF